MRRDGQDHLPQRGHGVPDVEGLLQDELRSAAGQLGFDFRREEAGHRRKPRARADLRDGVHQLQPVGVTPQAEVGEDDGEEACPDELLRGLTVFRADRIEALRP